MSQTRRRDGRWPATGSWSGPAEAAWAWSTGRGDWARRRQVALKLLPEALAGDQDFRARFLREMRVAAAIDHPNIVPIYRAGEDRGLLYLAMRYVHDADLRGVLEARAGWSPAEPWPSSTRWPGRWTPPTPEGWYTATSSRATSCSRPPVFDGDARAVYLVDFGLARSAATTAR